MRNVFTAALIAAAVMVPSLASADDLYIYQPFAGRHTAPTSNLHPLPHGSAMDNAMADYIWNGQPSDFSPHTRYSPPVVVSPYGSAPSAMDNAMADYIWNGRR